MCQVLKPVLRRGEARGVKSNSMIVLSIKCGDAVESKESRSPVKEINIWNWEWESLRCKGIGPHASLCRELLIKGFKKKNQIIFELLSEVCNNKSNARLLNRPPAHSRIRSQNFCWG